MPIDPQFPELIREFRTRLGLSQEKLAAKLRVSFPTVNRWENGKNHGRLFKSLLNAYVPDWQRQVRGRVSRMCGQQQLGQLS